MREQADNSARKHRVDNQPNRRKRYQAIDNDGADAPVPHKNRRYEVEVENAVQSPIDRAEQHEDVRN